MFVDFWHRITDESPIPSRVSQSEESLESYSHCKEPEILIKSPTANKSQLTRVVICLATIQYDCVVRGSRRGLYIGTRYYLLRKY